ncbi:MULTISPECIES: hypothetical protein [Vibrio]|uniref:Uncharacterized protein n=2 Tax=Vibrio TaxID=662 RepID=A0ABT5GRU3_9VIBR|nr:MULTISPECIES: hypothetical protein [Vibrio]OQQ07299.1 hypothetical protein BK411_13185 [Vibrio splendidus]KAA8675598.1 hypothetical protein F4W18_13305 [Vibrio gigantis]MCG9692047.1 hypothetical protein [Vibrio sp. Isolate22]MDA0155219.1 hypothetical protein [Vibrio sp. Makdt]MDC5725700.1 hypothetical protein [Vibrio europaeus]
MKLSTLFTILFGLATVYFCIHPVLVVRGTEFPSAFHDVVEFCKTWRHVLLITLLSWASAGITLWLTFTIHKHRV